jgi:surfeit locus 1 family protein
VTKRFTLRRIFVAFLLLGALATLLSLGTWQVRRLAWKEALLAEMEARRNLEPVEIDAVLRKLAAGEGIEYLPVRVRGQFDHHHEQHFFATHKGVSGYYVYTPLKLEDGKSIFINRGFVPFDRKDTATRAEGQVDGPVAIEGYARAKLDKKPSRMVPENDLAKNIYYWKDLHAMWVRAGLSKPMVHPFFIDADAKPNPGGLPVGGVTLFDQPNSHLQYAITWYGLALALVVIVVVVFLKGRRKGTAV